LCIKIGNNYCVGMNNLTNFKYIKDYFDDFKKYIKNWVEFFKKYRIKLNLIKKYKIKSVVLSKIIQ